MQNGLPSKSQVVYTNLEIVRPRETDVRFTLYRLFVIARGLVTEIYNVDMWMSDESLLG